MKQCTGSQVVASQIFWLTAALDVALAIGFELLVRSVNLQVAPARRSELARGQRKDNWLTCAVIWIGHLSESVSIHPSVILVAAMILAWLTQRGARRLRLLQVDA